MITNQPIKESKLVKIFIDGQNFYSRIRDFGLDLDDIDFQKLFAHILDFIKNDKNDDHIYISRCEWYSTGGTFIDHIPWSDLRKKVFTPLIQDRSTEEQERIIRTNTRLLENEPGLLHAIDMHLGSVRKRFKKIQRGIKANNLKLDKIIERYASKGIARHDNKPQNLIYLKKCGFLKFDYINEIIHEKGVDVAIASQMLGSILPIGGYQHIPDENDIIPNINPDIIVLITSDMDFLEPLKMLDKMKHRVYMVHLQNKLSKNMPTAEVSEQIHITEDTMTRILAQ